MQIVMIKEGIKKYEYWWFLKMSIKFFTSVTKSKFLSVKYNKVTYNQKKEENKNR